MGRDMRHWLLLVALGVAWTAEAQESKTGDTASGSAAKTTVINFEDETIQGDLTRPDGEYIEAAGKTQHSNLIKIREEFNDKVMQSVDEL